LTPVFIAVFFSRLPNAHLWAALVYATAAFTDVLDGFFARRYNQVTKLGRLLDPLADKLMGAAVIVCVALTYPSLWWAAALFFVKEALMGIGALIQYKKITDVFPSEFLGKFAVAFFFAACLAILVLQDRLSGPLRQILLGAAMLLSLIALARYIWRFAALLRKKKE